MASAADAQVAADEGEVAGLDGDVGAGAHGEAEVGLGEGGGVVDAVADHGDDPALGLQAADDVDLVGGQHLGDDRRRCRPRRRRPGRRRSLSPVSSTGRSPRPRSSAIASARGRLDGVGDDEHGRGPRRPSRRAPAVRPARLGARRRRPRARRRGAAPSRPRKPLAAGDDGVAVDDALHAEALGGWRTTRPAASGADPVAGAGGDGLGDRVLGGVLERAGEAQHLVGVGAVGGDARRRAPSGRW